MASSKKLIVRPVWMIAALPLLGWAAGPGATETLADLSDQQQAILQLKAAIERLKLQREHDQLILLSGAASEICRPAEGIGTLTLNTIYGIKKPYIAAFSYHGTTPIEATLGESLLCGEKVIAIALDHAVIEKQGQRYRIAGAVTASPLPSPPDSLR